MGAEYKIIPASAGQALQKTAIATESHPAQAIPAINTSGRQFVCSLGLITSDLIAFAAASSLANSLTPDYTSASLMMRAITGLTQGAGWHIWAVLPVLGLMIAYLADCGHYSRRIPFWSEARQVLVACAIALGFDCLLTNVVNGGPLALEPALRWALLLPFLLTLRGYARSLLTNTGFWTLNTLFVGNRDVATRAQAALASQPSLGYAPVGQIGPEVSGALHSPENWLQLMNDRKAEFLVVAGSMGETADDAHMYAMLDRARIPFAVVSAIDTLPVMRANAQYFLSHDVSFEVYQNNLARKLPRLMKVVFDYTCAALLLLILAPVMCAITLMIRMSGGPAMFKHKRIGADGKFFFCLKFRTMHPDGDRMLAELLANDPRAAAEWAESQKLRNDPRITPIGNFLRKTSLDELPQLLNVLRGEMSLVGPRPIVANEVPRYGDNIVYYNETRPGLTGLWQVSGRSDLSYARRVQLDVWYVRNWSLWHDIVILLKTVPALLLKRGAA